MPGKISGVTQRHMAFGAIVVVSTMALWTTVASLVAYSLQHESCSHIILIPLVSTYLLFAERGRIFSAVRSSIVPGAAVILAGAAICWAATRSSLAWQGNAALSAATLALALIWAGGFVGVYGLGAARAAAFPLLFLLLMIPLPDGVLAWTIHALQQGSTEVTVLLFKALGVPVLRQGFVLGVPGVTIEVASECSGIRSSIALFITCLLAAHLRLRTPWKILVFMLLVLPLTIIKNGIRIATLTLLAIRVDPGFLHGRLHHQGGFVFFFLALLLLLPVFLALEKSENYRAAPVAPAANEEPREAEDVPAATG